MNPIDSAALLNWHESTYTELWRRFARTHVLGRPLVIAVDGRSGAGKSTFAAQMARLHHRCAIVRTDDVAWHHSYFDWAELLIEHVLQPIHSGWAPITFTPPAWVDRDRPGALLVDGGTTVVIVEGVGAARRELRPWIDAAVWVNVTPEVGRRRVVARGVDTQEFIDDWTRAENEFLADHRPWETVDLVLAGDVSEDLMMTGRVLIAQVAANRGT